MNIRERRTIRKYSSRDVEKALLDNLIETAARAATMGNMQLYSVVVTRNQQMKHELAPLHFNQPMVEQAPVVLTFCADFHRFTEWCRCRNADTEAYTNTLSFLNAACDTLLFVQAFTTLAEEAGLGTCFLGTTLYNAQDIIQLLHLPKLTFPIATITIGWPDETPMQTDRLPLSAYVHEEGYQDYTPESIDQFYTIKESLPENQQFVAVNQKENLAQVFTDCRYTRKDNEYMSERLLETLKQQGFIR